MTTSISVSVHVNQDELHHRVVETGSGVITFGVQDGWPWVDAFFRTTAEIDAVIAELVALRNEMEPYAPPPANPPFFASDGEGECGAVEYGWICTAQAGHDGPDHIAYKPDGEGEYQRWPVAPVITDSERDCPALNPDGDWPCYRGGDHGVHRDANGDEWRTDLAETAASR